MHLRTVRAAVTRDLVAVDRQVFQIASACLWRTEVTVLVRHDGSDKVSFDSKKAPTILAGSFGIEPVRKLPMASKCGSAPSIPSWCVGIVPISTLSLRFTSFKKLVNLYSPSRIVPVNAFDEKSRT